MTALIDIHREPVRPLTDEQDLAVVSAAFARNPSPLIRRRLVALLYARDRFDEVIAILGDQPDLDGAGAELLAECLLARETAQDDEAALEAATRAVSLAGEDAVRQAASLALQGKALKRLGRREEAKASLETALALDPHSKDACKRLAALLLEDGDAAAAGALADRLADQGAAHSRLFAAKALAEAQQGDIDKARAAFGTESFLHAAKLPPPPGWDSIEAFNHALAEEVSAHPGMRFERYGSASELTWRIDWLPHPKAPLVGTLLDAIVAQIHRHVAGLADAGHAWAAAKPDEALLRSWSVITESEGYETWHVHQFGWLSGAYYVQVPDEIAEGEDEAGCIALGLPEDLAGEAAAEAYGLHHIRPESGLLLLFPSHTYHRTFPHGARSRRICVAFDVKPIVST